MPCIAPGCHRRHGCASNGGRIIELFAKSIRRQMSGKAELVSLIRRWKIFGALLIIGVIGGGFLWAATASQDGGVLQPGQRLMDSGLGPAGDRLVIKGNIP